MTTANSSSVQEQLDGRGVHIGTIWKSPRAKDKCIEATLRSYGGNVFADFRMLQLDQAGRMVPGSQRLTISSKQLGAFAKLAGDAFKKATAINET